MKRRPRTALVLGTLLALGSSLANRPLPKVWANWQYFRPIELPPTDSPHLASLLVPEDVFRHSRIGLSDLRIIDDLGNETGYALRVHNGTSSTVPLETKLVENSFAPGRYTQLVLSLGDNPPFHNAVEIRTEAKDFIDWVSVEASDDARSWRIVQPRAPFFQFASRNSGGLRMIPYSDNNARYLRIHILDGSKQFPVFNAVVFHRTETPPEREPLAAPFAPVAPFVQRRSAWIADLGGPGVPISEAALEVGGPSEFIRTVEIFKSDDGKEWNNFARNEIYRYKIGETPHQQMNISMPFGETQGRYWKIEVENGSDAPLQGVRIQLYTRPHHLYFEEQPGRSYRLLYGQTRAVAPQYDLTRRLRATQEDDAVAGQVGPEEANSAYADPRPWTEKNRFLLWVVVAIAALLLGYSAINSLRHMPSAPQQNS